MFLGRSCFPISPRRAYFVEAGLLGCFRSGRAWRFGVLRPRHAEGDHHAGGAREGYSLGYLLTLHRS